MVYKGCQKRLILLKNTDSELFEEAYFIMRERPLSKQPKEEDMVREANRIISGNIVAANCLKTTRKNKGGAEYVKWYAAGFLSCAAAGTLLLLSLGIL